MLNCKQFSIVRGESRYGQVRKEEKEGSEEEDDQEEGEEKKEEEVASNFWSTETHGRELGDELPSVFLFSPRCFFYLVSSVWLSVAGGRGAELMYCS